jgi:hypothetical protein
MWSARGTPGEVPSVATVVVMGTTDSETAQLFASMQSMAVMVQMRLGLSAICTAFQNETQTRRRFKPPATAAVLRPRRLRLKVSSSRERQIPFCLRSFVRSRVFVQRCAPHTARRLRRLRMSNLNFDKSSKKEMKSFNSILRKCG